MRSPSRSTLIAAIAAAGAWILAAIASARIGGNALLAPGPVWLPAGVALGLATAVPRWRMTALLAAIALAAFGLALWQGAGPIAAIGLGFGEALAAGLGATIARRAADSPDPVLAWAGRVGAAATAAVVAASVTVLVWSALRDGGSAATEWRLRIAGGFVGALLLAPVIVAFAGFRVKRSGGMNGPVFAAGAIAFAAFCAVAALVFQGDVSDRFGGSVGPTLAYVAMPCLVVAALLWGERGGTLAVCAGSLLLVGWTASGSGPFAEVEAFRGESLLEVQGYVVVLALLAGLVLAVQGRTAAALALARDWQVRCRQVLEGTGTVTLTADAVTGRCDWDPAAAALPGLPGAPDIATWIGAADPADQPIMRAEWIALTTGRRQAALWRWPGGAQARLAAVRGADGAVEVVTALVQRAPQAEGA